MKKTIFILFLSFLFTLSTNQTFAAANTVIPNTGNATMNQLLLKGISSRDLDMVKSAVQNNANVNIYENVNRMQTALTLSIGNDDIMRYLLSKGADPNAKLTQSGWIPPNKIAPLTEAIYHCDLNAVTALIEYGANINYADTRGYRALDVAITTDYSSIEIIKYLLNHGAIVNYTRKFLDNPTPLMLATQKGDVQIVKLLLDAGANRSLRDLNGQTALDYAIKKGNKEVINLLM